MIKIYYRGGSGSSKSALEWFKNHNIEVQISRISKVTKEDLVKILSLSDEGITDIIKCPKRSGFTIKEAVNSMMTLSFNEAVEFLLLNTIVLQDPIIIGEYDYLIGYNEEEIRKFLPKKYRRYNIYM